MNGGALVPFAFGDALVRVMEVRGDPWWVAGDIAKILGYREAYHLARILDDDEKGTHIVGTLGGDQEMVIISESGIYHAIFMSRRAEAKVFRRWVTGEVLPAIRRHGFYGAADRRAAELQALRDKSLTPKQEAEQARCMAALGAFDEAVAGGASITEAVRIAAAHVGRSTATIWSYRARSRMVLAADHPVALTPQYGGGGRLADIPAEAWLEFSNLMSRPGTQVATAYRRIASLAESRGWGALPVEETFRRRLKALRALPELAGLPDGIALQ